MLEGFDKDWVTTNEHRATYTNLPAGTYTFRVKATNNDGVWSKNEAKLKIVVHPPFWWSLPAKILYLLLIGWLILVLHPVEGEEREAPPSGGTRPFGGEAGAGDA